MPSFLGMSDDSTHTNFREIVEEIVDNKFTGHASISAPPLPAGVTSLALPSTDTELFAQASLVGAEGEGRLAVGVTLDPPPRVSLVSQGISDGTCSIPPRKAIRLETEPHVRWEGGKRSQGGMTGFERVTHMSCLCPTCDGVVAPALRADDSLPTPPTLDDQATRRDDVTIPHPHLSSDQRHTVRVDQTCTQQAGDAANPRQSLTQESVMSISSSNEEEEKRKELEGEGVASDLLKLSQFIFDQFSDARGETVHCRRAAGPAEEDFVVTKSGNVCAL